MLKNEIMIQNDNEHHTLNKVIDILKKILNSNIVFIIGVILVIYKTILLNYVLDFEITQKNITYVLLASLFIMSPTINNRKKFSYIYLNIIYIIITLIIYANFLYYDYSTNFISFYQIENIKYAKEIGDSLSCIMSLRTTLLFLGDTLIIMVISLLVYKNSEKIKYKNNILKIVLILAIFICNIIIIRKEIDDIYETKIYNKTIIVQEIAMYYYIYEDAKDYILSQFVNEKIDYERLENAYYQNKKEKPEKTEYTGIAKDSNVIILQLESLSEYIIGKKINGKEITPNLNKFFNNNIYCTDMYNQGLGSTADSEFEMNTSMYPLENGYVFQKYYENNWRDIYNILKEEQYYTSFMHPNDSTFWNRDAVYNFGYKIDEYNDIKTFEGIETAGEFYSDEGFFEKAVEIMDSYEEKFCSTLVSVTTHIPFTLEGVSDLESKTTITIGDISKYEDETFANYIISCNFVDYAFGKFINDLEKTGLINNSILVVYGDHGAGITSHEDIEKLYTENNIGYTEFENHILGTHVPFGIKIPNINESKTIQNAVSKIDIKPTILDLLGIHDEFSIGTTIFSGKDYSAIKGLGYITNEYYCFNDEYYDRKTLKQIEQTEQLVKLLEKMQNEIYLSDTIIKNNLIY